MELTNASLNFDDGQLSGTGATYGQSSQTTGTIYSSETTERAPDTEPTDFVDPKLVCPNLITIMMGGGFAVDSGYYDQDPETSAIGQEDSEEGEGAIQEENEVLDDHRRRSATFLIQTVEEQLNSSESGPPVSPGNGPSVPCPLSLGGHTCKSDAEPFDTRKKFTRHLQNHGIGTAKFSASLYCWMARCEGCGRSFCSSTDAGNIPSTTPFALPEVALKDPRLARYFQRTSQHSMVINEWYAHTLRCDLAQELYTTGKSTTKPGSGTLIPEWAAAVHLAFECELPNCNAEGCYKLARDSYSGSCSKDSDQLLQLHQQEIQHLRSHNMLYSNGATAQDIAEMNKICGGIP